MSEIKNLVVAHLKDYTPYKAASQDAKVILNANEHHYDFLNGILKEEFYLELSKLNLNRYPDSDSNLLREDYAKLIGVNKENLIASVGSDEGIRIISDTFLEAGEKVIYSTPTFSMYKEVANLAKGEAIEVESDSKTLNPNIDEIIKKAKKENVKIIYLCSPNNPTGHVYSYDSIKRIIDETNSIIVLDEAYQDFDDKNLLSLYKYSKRVIILRTMSKAFAGASLRVGFIIAQKETINFLLGAKIPYNLCSVSQVGARVLIKNYDKIKEEVEKIKLERKRVIDILLKYKDIKVFPPHGNYILIFTNKSKEFLNACNNKGISLRDYGGKMENYIRISIGNNIENDKLINVIKEVF